jgi:hypothetical protein
MDAQRHSWFCATDKDWPGERMTGFVARRPGPELRRFFRIVGGAARFQVPLRIQRAKSDSVAGIDKGHGGDFTRKSAVQRMGSRLEQQS